MDRYTQFPHLYFESQNLQRKPPMLKKAETLRIFQHELPDPDQQLFWQSLLDFPQFNKLPLELRLMVWRRTFPRRTVYLDFWKRRATRHNEDLWASTTQPPRTLYVNSESCRETLRYYKVLKLIHRQESICSSQCRRILFNGDMDEFKISSASFLTLQGMVKLWNKSFEMNFREFAGGIKHLRIDIEDWNSTTYLIKGYRPMEYFRNLAVFTVGSDWTGGGWFDLKMSKECRQFFEKRFKVYVTRIAGFRRPLLLIRRNGEVSLT